MAAEAALVYPGGMSDKIEPFKPGIYVKGDKSRRAETRADAVAAVFEGFVLDEATPTSESDADSVDPNEDEDAVNGVGTLGTGEVSDDDTPSPSALFGITSTF